MLGSEELLRAGEDRGQSQQGLSMQRNLHPGDAREEPGACLQNRADLQPSFSMYHILSNSLQRRLKWKSCPLLLSQAAFLHHVVLHPAKCSSPTSSILSFVFFFFFLEHYFSTGKLVTRLCVTSASAEKKKEKEKILLTVEGS